MMGQNFEIETKNWEAKQMIQMNYQILTHNRKHYSSSDDLSIGPLR